MNEVANHNASNPNWKVRGIVALFTIGLALSGLLRYLNLRMEDPPAITGYATIVYIAVTVFAALLLTRLGVPMKRMGFGPKFQPVRYLLLALLGVGLIQLFGLILDPLLEHVLGEQRDLSRFSDVAGSPADLIQLLLFSWTFAAIGEELAFRIVLMRGIASSLGDSRNAFIIALVAQAALFGFVHAYQGPTGIIGAGVNGLIYGGLTLAGRGSIWPAMLAHGLSNSVGILSLYMAG